MTQTAIQRMEARLDALMGTPFVSKGYDPDAGLDCWGLCRELLKAGGFKLPALLKAPDFLQVLLDGSDGVMDELEEVEKPVAGCIVVILLKDGQTDHCGILGDGGMVLQTTAQHGVCRIGIDRMRRLGKRLKFYVAPEPDNGMP